MDLDSQQFADFHDELPLWSASFGLLLLEHVPVAPELAVLDVGAGTGFLSLELAQRCGPRSRVIAVDPWSAAVDRLRRKVDWLGLHNVEIAEVPAEELDLPPESIDLVVSNLGLNNFERPDGVLAACHRLSRPGGRILATTNLVGHMAELYTAYRNALVELCPAALPVLERHIAHRRTVESVTALLDGAGYRDVEHRLASMSLRFAEPAALFSHALVRIGFLPAWIDVVGEREWPRIRSAIELRLARLVAERGEIRLDVPIALFEATA